MALRILLTANYFEVGSTSVVAQGSGLDIRSGAQRSS